MCPVPVPSLTDLIHDIVDATDDERPALINNFARTIDDDLKRVAYSHLRHYAIPHTYLDDVHQILHLRSHSILTDVIANPQLLTHITSWVGWVKSVSRNDIAAFKQRCDGAAQMAGLSSLIRRQARLHSFQSQLRRKLGREPRPMEVIEAANEPLRDKPKSSHMMLTLADFTPGLTNLRDINEEIYAVHDDESGDALFAVLAPHSARKFMNTLMKTFEESDQSIIRTWIAPVLGGSSDPCPIEAVALAHTVEESHVEDIVARVKQAALIEIGRDVDTDVIEQFRFHHEH